MAGSSCDNAAANFFDGPPHLAVSTLAKHHFYCEVDQLKLLLQEGDDAGVAEELSAGVVHPNAAAKTLWSSFSYRCSYNFPRELAVDLHSAKGLTDRTLEMFVDYGWSTSAIEDIITNLTRKKENYQRYYLGFRERVFWGVGPFVREWNAADTGNMAKVIAMLNGALQRARQRNMGVAAHAPCAPLVTVANLADNGNEVLTVHSLPVSSQCVLLGYFDVEAHGQGWLSAYVLQRVTELRLRFFAYDVEVHRGRWSRLSRRERRWRWKAEDAASGALVANVGMGSERTHGAMPSLRRLVAHDDVAIRAFVRPEDVARRRVRVQVYVPLSHIAESPPTSEELERPSSYSARMYQLSRFLRVTLKRRHGAPPPGGALGFQRCGRRCVYDPRALRLAGHDPRGVRPHAGGPELRAACVPGAGAALYAGPRASTERFACMLYLKHDDLCMET